MLCSIPSTNKVAVAAEAGLTFIDLHTSKLHTKLSSSYDHVFPFQNKFIAWSSSSMHISTFSSSGVEAERKYEIPNLSSLLPFGEDMLLAYLDRQDAGYELVLLDADMKQVDTIKTLKKRSGDVKCKQYSASSQGCAVFTKGTSSIVGYRKLPEENGSANNNQYFTLKVPGTKTCITVLHHQRQGAKTTVCSGLDSGKIMVSRFGEDYTKAVTSELHWHSSAVLSLTLVNDLHLLSGGNEGTLVMWKLDQGTQSRDFRPRLGAPIVSTCLAQDSQAACVMLKDGTMIQVNLPQMNLLARKIHVWTPSTTTVMVKKMDTTDVALYDEAFHNPGVIKITSRFPHEEEQEHAIDVTQRNAVSSSAAAFRWKLEVAKFSPNGRVLVTLLTCQGKHEARIYLDERESLRVSLAHQSLSASVLPTVVTGNLVAVTNRACAIVDPNCANKIVILHLLDKVWSTQTVFDLAPQNVHSVALSDDNSCVACLCDNGLIRVFDRNTGNVVLTHSLPLVDESSGIGFSKHSREVFAWNKSRVDALVAKKSLIGVDIRFAATQHFVDSIAVLVRNSDGRWEISMWNAVKSSALEPVQEVSPREDLLQFEYAGKELGWLLKTNAGWEVAASSSDDGSMVLGGARRLPGIALKTTAFAQQDQEKRGLLSNNNNSSVPDVADWCHDLPSHLLHNPPPLQLVWPTWGAKPAEAPVELEPVKPAKRSRIEASTMEAIPSVLSNKVAEQSEQEHIAFEALFKSF